MKKYLPYVLGFIGLLAMLAILLGAVARRPRKMDEHLSFRYNDKVPYGYFCAYHLLPTLFPHASVSTDSKEPAHWNKISYNGANQALILVAPYFSADSYELDNILSFVSKGNHVLIIAKNISFDARHFFHIESDQVYSDEGFMENSDSLTVRLETPPFTDSSSYVYPGKRFSSFLGAIDSVHTAILGRNANQYPNFVQYRIGSGTISLHLAPLAFSNYFLLRQRNYRYYSSAMSVIPETVSRIVWNDYYLYKPYERNDGEKEPNWLGVLFRYREFKWALLTAMMAMLLFAALGMRRTQRMIPAYQPLPNDSLDFTKTLGRLYYEKGDHADLARKMAAYFLEHVRSRYKLPASELNEQFVQALHQKSGYAADHIRTVVDLVRSVQGNTSVSEAQLLEFYRQLELFYQNT